MKTVPGFTLIELLVTLAILAILVAAAGPSLTSWIQTNRITTATFQLVSQLNYVRSEALRTSLAVNLARTGSTAKDFSKGWEIYTDATSVSGNTAFSAADKDTPLRKFAGYGTDDITINVSTAGEPQIAFAASGMLSEGGSNVLIAICDSRGVNFGRLITVTPLGRTLVTTASATTPLASCSP